MNRFLVCINFGFSTDEPDVFCMLNDTPIVGNFDDPHSAIYNVRDLCKNLKDQQFGEGVMLYMQTFDIKLGINHEYKIRISNLRE